MVHSSIFHKKHTLRVIQITCLPQKYFFTNSSGKLQIQATDFDPDSLRSQLPKAVSSLEWAISKGKGRVYVHCTAGLGRAPAVAIAYLFWFCNMDVSSTASPFICSKILRMELDLLARPIKSENLASPVQSSHIRV